jgi:hypothetical protein
VPDVTLIPYSKMNIVTKYQVSILKHDEARRGVWGAKLAPLTLNLTCNRVKYYYDLRREVRWRGEFNPLPPKLNKFVKGVTLNIGLRFKFLSELFNIQYIIFVQITIAQKVHRA